jgi:hypothetical protein
MTTPATGARFSAVGMTAFGTITAFVAALIISAVRAVAGTVDAGIFEHKEGHHNKKQRDTNDGEPKGAHTI